jgi:preprotein translocase subunit SecG
MPGWMKWAVALLIGGAIIVAGWRLTDSRWFFWLLPSFFVVNCLVLIIVVLLQSGKAADLAGAFGGAGSQTAFGPRGAANVLSKATTWCAIMFMLCAMALVLRTDRAVERGGSVLQDVSKPAPKKTPAATPATPQAPAPGQTNQPAAQQPAAQQPAQQAPAGSQPASAPPKKP